MEAAYTLPSEESLKEEFVIVSDQVHGMIIKTEAEYIKACEIKRDVKGKIAAVIERFKPAKQASYDAHKKISDLERLALSRLKEIDESLDKMIVCFVSLKQEEQVKRQEIERQEAEVKARYKAEAENKRKIEEALNQAVTLEDRGREDLAEVLLSPMPAAVAPVIPILSAPRPALPKAEGVSTREDYSAEVFDLKALILAVAQGQAPMACVKIDQSFLNNQAKSLKAELNYPGVKVVKILRTITRK